MAAPTPTADDLARLRDACRLLWQAVLGDLAKERQAYLAAASAAQQAPEVTEAFTRNLQRTTAAIAHLTAQAPPEAAPAADPDDQLASPAEPLADPLGQLRLVRAG